jgi:hypothetical protein
MGSWVKTKKGIAEEETSERSAKKYQPLVPLTMLSRERGLVL